MDFNFGEKMKILRKKRDLTQEQLAEHLGVSPQAISKWETNVAYPDITLFPIIANYYGVTTDELLGVDILKSNDVIKEYYSEMDVLYHQWKLKEMVELCRKACYEFPANLRLKYHLAWCLGQAQNVIATKEENLNEAIIICKKILEESLDTQLRLSAITLICHCYHWLGDDETALDYTEQLPGIYNTRTFIIGAFGLKKGIEKIEYSKRNINIYFNSLFSIINQLVDVKHCDKENNLTEIDRIEMLNSMLIVLKEAYGNNLRDKNWDAYEIHRDITILLLRVNKIDEAIAHLEKAYDYAVLHGLYSDDDCYESPLLKGVKVLPHNHWSQSALKDMYNEFFDDKYSISYEKIKDDPRYIVLAEKLQNN